MPPEGEKVSENGTEMWLIPAKSTSRMSITPLANTAEEVSIEPGGTLPTSVVLPDSLSEMESIRLPSLAVTKRSKLPRGDIAAAVGMVASNPRGLKSIELPVTVGSPTAARSAQILRHVAVNEIGAIERAVVDLSGERRRSDGDKQEHRRRGQSTLRAPRIRTTCLRNVFLPVRSVSKPMIHSLRKVLPDPHRGSLSNNASHRPPGSI